MTAQEKLETLKLILQIADDSQDTLLAAYLDFAKKEILSAMYCVSGGVPDTVTDVPIIYEPTQIMACVTAYNMIGAEGQTSHNENGINRVFRYAEITEYIQARVVPMAGVV